MTSERTRRSLALAAALGVHLVATLVVRSFSVPQPQVSLTTETIVEVSISEELAAAPFAALPGPSSVSGEPPAGVAASPTTSRRVQEAAAMAAVTASREAPGDTGLPGAQDSAGTPDIHPRGVDFVARTGSSALDEGPAPASISGGVIEALDAADVERGLGRGGPVNTAVDAAARQDGPVRGNATFSVTVFSDGHVDVQKVVVAVEASVRYPDGYVPPASTEVDVAAKAGPDQPGDSVAAGAPRVTLSVRGKRCQFGVTVSVGGIGAGVDCSVAGVAARQIATRIVSESRL